MKFKKATAIILTLMMLLSLVPMITATAAGHDYYKAYDITFSETGGISFKFDFDETGHNQFVRCDMEICTGTSATDPSTAFPGLGMPYKNTLKTDKGQADLVIDKTNDVAKITIHPEEIDLTGIDADHQHVWMMTRPCYNLNALDTLNGGNPGGTYYNDFIYLGQYASAEDFKNGKMISFNVTVDEEIENGSISIPGSPVNEGEVVELTITPDAGYKIDKVFVDDVEIEPKDDKYTFVMPDHDVKINVIFKYDCSHNNIKITANNNVITATCADEKCDKHTNPLTLTLTAPDNLVYNGDAKEITFADGEKTAWTEAGLPIPTITYEAKEGSSLTNGKAVNPGNYTAILSFGEGQTAALDFTIVSADKTASTRDSSNIELWSILFVLSSVGFGICLKFNKEEIVET